MSSAAHTGKKVESFESHNVKSGGKKKKKKVGNVVNRAI